ncbi:MAG: hypothetical protein KDB01_23780, partial [Planctomycetaceae bacterium]|nr:hypothetical protein [Planctomycetaceae bacterium]
RTKLLCTSRRFMCLPLQLISHRRKGKLNTRRDEQMLTVKTESGCRDPLSDPSLKNSISAD